jgi:hypothetical protein
MRDLIVIVPSRGRPGNVARFVRAVAKTSTAQTDIVFGFDNDDPDLQKSVIAAQAAAQSAGVPVTVITGPRKGLGAWTNELAATFVADYRALASFGDDHVPQTCGWDKLLLDAINDMGGCGIAYPNDGIRDDVCEAVVLSSAIVGALGWMCEPTLKHWWVDNVWADLGREAGCLRYLPDVIVRHNHPAAGRGQFDATYWEAFEGVAGDKQAYETWRAERMETDVATVRALRAASR